MDVEKTIQFLIENSAQHDARIAALQNALITLTSVVKTLADNATAFQEATYRSMDEMRREMRERDAKMDERIGKLVSAIAARESRGTDRPPTQH